MRSKECLRFCHSRKLTGLTTLVLLACGLDSHTITRPFGSANGMRCSITALTTLKIDVFAPIPNASASTAMIVKPGFLHSIRQPKRKSLIIRYIYDAIAVRLRSRRSVPNALVAGRRLHSVFCFQPVGADYPERQTGGLPGFLQPE